MTRRTLATLLGLLLSASLVACGDDDEATTADSTTTTSATSAGEAPGSGPDAGPERIVSLSPTATETLFAIGAGDAVVAVDDNSNYPEEAPTTDLSGFEPNVEAIAGYEPDLVVMADDAGETVQGLEKLDIDVLLLPAATTVEEAYDQILELGEVTAHEDEADALVDDMRADIDEIVADTGDAGSGLTYYYELDPTYYSVTSRTFIGQLLALLGLENIADAAQAEASDYPQLSSEFIVQQDPDLILLADTKCCDQDAAAVRARAGWSNLSAVEGDGVVELDDDIASRWGPRIVELLDRVGGAVQRVAA